VDTRPLFSHVLAAGPAEGRLLDVFIAGDDAQAKTRVSAFIESLGLPAASVPADVLMVPGYFGFLANIVTQNYPASSLITRRTLGWEPAQPGLLADLDNGHYFSAG
jgi:hypothetical protein